MFWRTGLPLLLVLGVAACAYPDVTLQQAARPPVAATTVSVLTDQAQARDYIVLGRAYAWSSIPVSRRAGYAHALELLRQRAAGVGATALLVPPAERIDEPAVQAQWMDRVEGWQNGDYMQPQELTAVLLVRP